jgi:hypothetical protein
MSDPFKQFQKLIKNRAELDPVFHDCPCDDWTKAIVDTVVRTWDEDKFKFGVYHSGSRKAFRIEPRRFEDHPMTYHLISYEDYHALQNKLEQLNSRSLEPDDLHHVDLTSLDLCGAWLTSIDETPGCLSSNYHHHVWLLHAHTRALGDEASQAELSHNVPSLSECLWLHQSQTHP